MEWGIIPSVTSSIQTVSFDNCYTTAVVVTSIQYDNIDDSSAPPVVTRISSVTRSSFDIRLQTAGGGTISGYKVFYLVVEEGSHTVDGQQIEAQKYTSSVTDENDSWLGTVQTYMATYSNPVVVGQVMSSNDPRWSVFWERGGTKNDPPTSSVLYTGKTVCEDTNTTRADEVVGFIVFEQGHGTMNGIEFEARLGGDTVQGIQNSPPYPYSFTSSFPSAPTVAVVSMATVDGGNGGWAYVYGSQPLNTTTLNLAIDEDTIGDPDRNHITEQVAYIVFSSPGSA